MILEGNQRGGARDLARHLMKPENEHIEVLEVRGFVADTLMGALREAEAVSRGTKCAQHLYSLSLSPPQTERVPVAVFEDAIDRIEAKLGLAGHPRVVVFHEKKGRRHAHCVWSRINAETMTAVRMSHDRHKLGDISRQLYIEHGWKMPEGLIDRDLRNPLDFDRKEWFQAQRAGKDPRDIKATFQQCWHASDSGKAFRQALEQRGYWLAQGDRRAVVAVDLQGEVYAVARWIGLRTKDAKTRISDLDELPSVQEVQALVGGLLRSKLSGFVAQIADEFARAAETLEGKRLMMVERHRSERKRLEERQTKRASEEARERAAKFRRGLVGLWDRLTGKHSTLKAQNAREFASCMDRDRLERQTLIDRQLGDRQLLQDEIRSERALHSREVARLHKTLTKSISGDREHSARDDIRSRRQRHSGPTP